MTSRNWKAMESNGLFHVGVIFPEFKSAASWREHALARQFEELQNQVYPDGAQIELTPHYHNVSLHNFAWTLSLAQLNDLPVPAGYAEALESQYDMNLWAMMPDRTWPNFNDSGRRDCAAMLREGLKLFPHRKDWQWIVTDGREGQTPGHASHLFSYAGWAIMRSGWDRDARCLAMQAGSFGAAHQHEGKLNFIIDGFGARLVCEGGIFTYDASIMRRYVLSAAAHNVVSVDGLEQHRRGGPSSCYVRTTPAPLRWQTTTAFDAADAMYGEEADERWGEGRVAGLRHRRQVVFVKPDYWIVIDTLTPGDRQVHRYQSIFHLDAVEASVDEGKQVRARNATGVGLAVIPVNEIDLTVSIVQGQQDPYQGWIAETLYDMRAVPTICFGRQGVGEVRFIYAFAPSPAGKPSPVRSIDRISGDGGAAALSLAVELSSGSTDRITIAPKGDCVRWKGRGMWSLGCRERA